jgi:hypothetical protein
MRGERVSAISWDSAASAVCGGVGSGVRSGVVGKAPGRRVEGRCWRGEGGGTWIVTWGILLEVVD